MADEQIVTSIVAKADLSSLVSEVHRASASLQQLQRELLSSNRAIASSTKLANNLFRDTLTGSGQFSSHFVNLNSDVDKFGKNLDAGRLKLKSYFSTFREHATTQKGMIRELAKEQVMLQNAVLQPLGRNAQGLMQYNVMIPRGLDAVKNGTQLARMEMQIMNRALSEGAGSLINWGKNTQWAGRQLTVGLTVPLTMFGAAAGKAFREADAELVRLTKVYGGLAATSAGDLKAIREEVVRTAKSLSQTMGASFKDTIALGADIAATGQMGNELLGSIAETTRLSILGEVDRQDAMKATLSIQTAFKQNTEELTESINFLNAVENQTSTTLGDLVEAIPKAGPVIQQLGGDVKDLALYLTAMREGGINASEGANALKSGLASLINPTKQTVGMMSDFGIDVMGMVAKNTGDTTGLLTDLQKALDSLDPLSKARAMEQMFGKFQFARMSALLNNLGKEGSQTLQVMELMKASTSDLAGIAERELGMITESASGKYKRAMESLKASLADIGEDFLPIATKLLNAASKILEFFSNLPAPIKKAVTFLAGFTALVGPLIMLTGVLANFFGYITKGIVQLRAFFMKANGWKMLTPEIIAAQKAAEMVENAFYSDAAAAQVLHNALQKLVLDYQNLQAASMKGAVPVNPGVSTIGGSTIVTSGRRIVDPTDPYVGDVNTRAMSHINPRDPNNPATIFGGVPGAVPVNRGISRTPQIYMHDRLPDIEGLTSIKGISTGIVPGEAAKHHALMATLGMQSEQEIAALKKTIAMGGTVSRELLDTFDDILPITQRFADSAATQSAAIVQQMRNAEITVEQAKARIIALNAQIEADMGAAVSLYAAGRGRTIDLTRAPMMDQPVVDANGQFTLRDLYKKKANLSVLNEFGRLRGIRTFGAPYSIQTTRPPRFNDGGSIESFGPSKTMVSGPSSINYDDRLGSVPVGGYVLNQQAAMDPANAALVAMAPSTYLNNGGNITAALTPREVVFGPQIQRMPELYAAVDAANSGYNFGGQIMNGVTGYGRQTSKTPQIEDKAYYKKRLKEYLRFINNPRYEDDIRLRMIMLDAAEMVGTAKMPMSKAIGIATSNFDLAKQRSGGSLERFIELRVKQVQGLERKFPELKLADPSDTRTGGGSKSLNYELNNVRSAMLADRRFKNVWDLIEGVSPTDIKNSQGMPLIQGLHARGHVKRHGTVGYGTRGHMGVAAVIPSGINSIMARLQDVGISPDVLNLTGADARKNFEIALKSVGMHRMTTVDDIATALEENNLFKTKAEIASGNVVRATPKQRNDLQMFLEAVMSRKRWVMIPRGRPPMMTPVLARLNKGGMIPGGSISRERKSYGNPMSLLAPEKMLKILAKARELSSRSALGSFADMPVTKYGHQIAPSSGMSYPIPGVSGVYRDASGKLVFVKGVNHQVVADHEPIGARIVREAFEIHAPIMGPRTVSNPLDPTKKTKLLALESDYDPRFGQTNIPWKEDAVIRQLAASLLMNNKDLSRSNVFGNFNPDVGQAGVFKKASGNTALALPDELNSMEKQAMINLLAVRGGARKDFARDTAPIVAKMSPKKYGRLMKKTLENARPALVKIIGELPKDMRAPYIAMLKRLDDGIDVDWSKYHALHANPTYLNSGGPIGGPIKRGRSAYGRKGNPAARAEQERLKKERAASYQVRNSGSSYTATGNPQMQVTRVPYVGGTGVIGNAYSPSATASSAATINALRIGQLSQLPVGISSALDSLTKTVRIGSERLRAGLQASGLRLAQGLRTTTSFIVNTGKASVASTRRFADWASRTASATRNSILMQQAAVTARHYPNGGFDPYQRSYFGPGMVGNWQSTGQDGIQKRKVGSLGFRKTEFMVDGQNMTRAQARAAGVAVPGRGPMGMGTQMGIGMAGSMAGMALMSKEKVKVGNMEMSGMSAGMGVMAASSIVPFLPYAKMGAGLKTAGTASLGLAKGMAAAYRAGTFLSKILPKLLHFAKVLGPIGAVISIASVAFGLFKAHKDAQQDATMGLSMTARAAEEAGVKYFNLQETMQGYLDKQTAILAAGKASRFSSIGMPGLPQSIEDMKKAKEEGKGLKDLIESINRSTSTAETKRLVTNQKAQYVAAGMSVAEANRKIYGALLNSEKSSQVFDIIGNSQFGSITDKASAAEYSVSNLINTLNKGEGTADWGKEVGSGFEGLINTFSAATNSLIGTKDALGNVIDEYRAWQMVMGDAEKNNPKMNDPIGDSVYQNLIKSQPLLELIANKSDTIKGILSKWKLFTSGIAIDLAAIDSEMANKLAGFTQAIGTGIAQLTKAADSETTFSSVGSALERLKKTIGSVSAASQRSAAAAQRSAQEELKLISKKIKLIDDEKNKKLEALRATQDASNYALELQKLQIEYADAVSRGDMATATRAQLDIDQLTMNRQTELAQKAIEDAANRAKAPLEKKATGIQEASDKKSNILAGQQDAAAAASEIAGKLTDFQEKYNEIVERGIAAQVLPAAERKKEEKAVRESLIAFAKEVQTAGTGSSALAKEIRNAFFKLGLFDKDGKPIPVETKTPTNGMPTGFDKNGKPILPTVTTVNAGLTEQFAKDMKAVTSLALDITGGTTIHKLRLDLLEALGKSGAASLADPANVAGTITPATGSKPAVYRNKAGEIISKAEYETLPAAPAKEYKAYSIPLEGLSNKLFPGWSDLNTQFRAASGNKGTWESPDGLVYDTAGNVRKNGKMIGRWLGFTALGKFRSYNQGSIGGVVSGPGTATSDSIPALLSNGEYVIRASSVAKYGTQTFDALNAQKFNKGGAVQELENKGRLFNEPQPAVDYTPPPSTPISKLGKTTQAQIKYLNDWTNLLNTYYSAKYKGMFDLGPDEKIVSRFSAADVINGLKKQKSIIPWLQKTSEYNSSQVNGFYWQDDRSIQMGLANQQRGILYNPYQDIDGNLNGSVPNAINITPAQWLEDNAKETQKNPFSRAEMLTVLFHEFAHALQFSLNGKRKNTQSLMGLGENGSESVPTPWFDNVETAADLMAGGIFKEMYSNGYIPQIKASVIKTLLGSRILKQTGTQPNFNVNEQTAPEDRTWHPLNDNFRFQTWAKGFEVGDSAAIDDSLESRMQILSSDGSNPRVTYGSRANIEAAKAAISAGMIPKGFHKGGPAGHKHLSRNQSRTGLIGLLANPILDTLSKVDEWRKNKDVGKWQYDESFQEWVKKTVNPNARSVYIRDNANAFSAKDRDPIIDQALHFLTGQTGVKFKRLTGKTIADPYKDNIIDVNWDKSGETYGSASLGGRRITLGPPGDLNWGTGNRQNGQNAVAHEILHSLGIGIDPEPGSDSAYDHHAKNPFNVMFPYGPRGATFVSQADTEHLRRMVGYYNIQTSETKPVNLAKGGLALSPQRSEGIGDETGPRHFPMPRIKADGSLSSMIMAAESMLGYKEGEKDNDTFFGEWQNENDKDIKSRFISWCGAFMNWAANTAGVPLDNMVYTAGGANDFKSKGAFHKSNPKVGDMAFFNWAFDNDEKGQDRIQHIGLVRRILSDTLLETIEGNTAEVEPPLVFKKGYKPRYFYDDDNLKRIKDGVFRRRRLYNDKDSSIVGFGRPRYTDETTLQGKIIAGGMPRIPMDYVEGFKPKGYHAGGAVGHKHDVNPITKGFRWFKNAMNGGQNPASAMLMDVINQAGYLGQTGLSSLTKGLIPKPTKVQDKAFQEFTGIPGTYRALTNKSAEGPLGQESLSAQKVLDWSAAVGWAIPAARSAAAGRASLATAATNKVVGRQGVQVFDRRFPPIANDVMQLTGVKTKPLVVYDDILTKFKEVGDRAKIDNPSRPVPEILPGRGAVNLYGNELQWGLRTAWMDGKRLGKLKKMLSVLNGKPVADNAPYANRPTGNIYAPNNISSTTLFHELGHRDLNLYSPTSRAVLGDKFSYNPRSGIHEGYADLFSSASRATFENYGYQAWVKENFPSPFKDGDSYVTNSDTLLGNDWRSFVEGINTGRTHQVQTQFLNDYLSVVGHKLDKTSLDKIDYYKQLLDSYAIRSYGQHAGLQSMLTGMKYNPETMAKGGLMKLPKFEAGINVVPEDMLALIHKNEAVVPANMNPFNPNATSSAIASGSVYNIQVELNGTTVTAQDVAAAIHKEMKIKEMTAGVNRRVNS